MSTTADVADDAEDDADEPGAAADGTAIGGGPLDEATKLAAEPKERVRGREPGRRQEA